MEDYEIPQDVIENWLKECHCCPLCGQDRPCEGVMAGGLCDDFCQCDEEIEEDYSLPWD